MSDSSAVVNPIQSPDRPSWELYSVCIHCGLCLSACPTYRVLGTEMDSPRGRIYQVLQADAGRLPVADSFVTHIDRCLDCRACESACPSGVEYGRIVERARAVIETQYQRPWYSRWVRGYVYGKVLSDYRLLARYAKVLRWLQRSGVSRLARRLGLLKLLGLQKLDTLAPQIDQRFYFEDAGRVVPAVGEQRGRVAFLAGCIASVAFSELNRATVRVLQQNGIEVIIPAGQGCCGALHAHAGFRQKARELAKRNIQIFLDQSCDAIITNAAGCGSTMKEYDDLLEHDPEFASRAGEFTRKVKDVTEYLAAIGLRAPRKTISARVTYQDACHLAHGQHIRSAPRELLQAAGATLVEMPHADYCCGSAGVYNVVQNRLSMEILDRKMDDIQTTPAEIIAAANPGCMLQLRAGVAQRKMKAAVKHVIELLDECYQP